MQEEKRSVESALGRQLWVWPIVLILMLIMHACKAPEGSAVEPSSPPSAIPAARPTRTAVASFVLTETASTFTPAPAQVFLPTAVPRPTATWAAHVEEPEIVNAILGQGITRHWAAHPLAGSFTESNAEERLALVGHIGDLDEVRWVVIERTEDRWQLRGASEWLGSGFDAPPSFYLAPDVLDFDNDGQQELLSHYSRTQRGWTTSADVLYRWDGRELARIWGADTVLDNTLADHQDAPQPYRENYQAEWEWVDLDGNEPDEILLREHATFYPAGSSQGEFAVVLTEETWERSFRWDGTALRPFASGGPSGIFAYTVLGDLWLWQNHAARPLGVEDVREFRWSPDGARLAWWAKPSVEGDSQMVTLGVYDLAADVQREFSLGTADDLSTLSWSSDGRLVYTVLDQPLTLLDWETGQIESLPDVSTGTWSPDGKRFAYERDENLYVYDLSTHQERALVVRPEEAGSPAILPHPVWSPRGDWIACYLADESSTWVGLVTPDLTEPLSSFELWGTFSGREAPELEFFWSPEGSHLAVLATHPQSAQQPTVLYVADVAFSGDDAPVYTGVAHPEWQVLFQLESLAQPVRVAWSPDGREMALAVGSEIWETNISGETAVRRLFSMPGLEWTTLEWSPDGRGFLVGVKWVYDEHLYWFPSDGTDPVLLVAGSLGTAHWSAQTVAASGPEMVLVEYIEGGAPLVHFADEDGSTAIISAKGAERSTQFQIGGDRVYYNMAYVDRRKAASLIVSDALAGCRPPMPSPDGGQLAWLCDYGLPDWSDLISGTAEIYFRLVATDDQGRNPREVWSYVETGPDYRDVDLVSWRRDGGVVYLSRPKYGTAWAYFDYNPGIMALDLNTGQTAQIGDLEGIHDGLVSPDGVWLAQSKISERPNEGVFIIVRSLIDETERVVACAEGATVAGDFSFSPGNTWLAWREWATAPGGSIFLIRVLRLPNGEPLTVYGDAELTAPKIGGWLNANDLVLVYPLQEDGTGGHSTVVSLPAIGAGDLLSPHTFVGLLNETP
jgi:Tol biopolymer transport system component